MSDPPAQRHRGLVGRAPADHGVRIVDTPAVRVHHPADLVGAVLSLIAIVLVLVLAVFAHRTTTGITQDVQGVAVVVRRILFVPVAVLEGLVTFIAPVAVLAELVMRRLLRQAFEAVAGALLAVLTALLAAWLITKWGVPDLRSAFSIWSREANEALVTIPALMTGTAGLLTAVGQRSRRRTVAWSWNLLWVALGVALITGAVTLPGALLTVLIGRTTGLSLRYAFGVRSERAYGPALVEGIQRAGFTPVRLIRVRDVSAAHLGGDDALATDLAAVAITRYGDNRVYAMTTENGDRLDVVVLDGDRQVVGTLTRFWRSMRLRGIDGRTVVSLRQAAERAALLCYAAWSAGVCTPRLLGLAESEDSMILIQQHARGAVPLRDLPPDELTDEVLDAIWEQLSIAHGAGLAHRALTADVVLVNPDADACPPDSPAKGAHDPDAPVVLLTGWESGDVASSELARRMDISAMLALLALRVGAERAVASAARTVPDTDLVNVGPLLQPIAFPRATREEARGNRDLLGELRETLLARMPSAVVEPERLVRLGARTVVMIVAVIIAAVAIVTTLNFGDIRAALAQASPWWALVAFGLGLVTFLGSALTVVAFAPVKLSLWRTTLVQAAAAYVSLGAPAGVGPAALNLRMLTKRGVSNALAVASVGLVQLAQFVTTLLLLVVFSLVSGSDLPMNMPSTTTILVIGLVAVAVTATMFIPAIRQWLAARVIPVWRATWPRLVQLIGQPKRFGVAIAGSLVMSLGYLGAFWASLGAFGLTDRVSLIDLALVYLLGNAAGAVSPTPGGLGTIELALAGALSGPAGVPIAFATSAVILFRALTFWGRIPIGWVAMRALRRRGEL